MKVFTEKDYFIVTRLFPEIGKIGRLSEPRTPYYLGSEDEYEVHNEHDKLFKKILERPKDAEFIIKKALKLDEKKSLDITSVRNEFVTVDFRGKQADMIYKLKDKEVYFIIEHQSTQDEDMAFRVLEYQIEVMRRAFWKNSFKRKHHAKVITIVIYTGQGEWKELQSIDEIQEKFGYKIRPTIDYQGIGEYNVLSISNCTNEELLKDDTFISKAILIEKVRGEDELINILDKMLPTIKEDERADMIGILRYVLIKDLGKEKAEKYIKILEGGIDMGGFVNELRADRERTILRAEEKGKKEGRVQEAIRVAKSMLKEKIDIATIEKITRLNRNQFM